ncbi:DNA polymerase elongation subunit family B [Halorubrum tailed virus 25]|uniref:DNA-directed DNA polymerase n=1 Tax=Halorubrum tailed virus 25 TaxID=2878006 RepID=A0AAE8XZP4_9CAUD|nr:DNA polymerase elongation subunit family B [Halorubrum tailed virus 25]UBF22626.1 DNA polymerase elongation subunit family B [Halorubrum tailed virus 25]
MKLLITNTEAVTNDDGTEIHLYGRDADGNRHHVEVTGFEPYFYTKTEYVEGRESDYLGDAGIKAIEHDEPFSPFGETGDVSRVILESPKGMKNAASLFPEHYEADVKPAQRFRIDTGVTDWCEVPETECHIKYVSPIEAPVDVDPETRIVNFDIEVDDRGGFPEPGEKRITSIVAHDNYTDEYIGFIDGDGRPIEEMFPNGKPEEVDALHVEPDERRMLITFGCWLAERDPDLLTAWNVDFDAPYVIERMKRVGASPDRLSPLDEAYTNYFDEAKIKGRSVYDLLTAYKKNSWGELRSYSLDYVAGEELGASKIHHDEGYFQMFEEDPELLVNYNARDVRLAHGINEEAGVIEFRDNLRKQIGVDFEDTVNNYQFIEMMARRKLRERGEVGPTADPTDAEKYEGGFVMDAYTGVARNVMGIDVESLYPWTMYMLNASPDTKIDEARAKAENIPYSKAPNGVCFRLDRDGLFKSLVEDALDLKEGFRDLKNAAEPGSVEEALYAVKYQVSKTITNSIYGVIGWDRFFLYDRETAEAVTLAGQAVVKGSADFVDSETDAEVIYGDTDSNYISFPTEWEQERCVLAALEICDRLEAEVYPPLAESMNIPAEDCEWRIDPEMFAPRFLQWGKKKKYAYSATWKEGMEPDAVMDEPDVSIKGSAAKRSDASRLTRDTEKAVIKAVLSGNEGDVDNLIYEAAKKIDPANPDWNAIGIPGGIGQELDEYDTETAHVRAAKNGNELLGTEFGEGSKPMRCYLRPTYFDGLGDQIDVIGYEDADDLRPIRDRLTVDAGKMTDTLLVNPMGEMLEAVGVDVDAAVSGQHQTGLGAFV